MDYKNILFIDIETVPQRESYDELDEKEREFWNLKANFISKGNHDDTPDSLYERAGIYAEYGKVICISCGFIHSQDGRDEFRSSSFTGNESDVLIGFRDLLESNKNRFKALCAHNGREFDFPYLCRRMLINDIDLPELLSIHGKKPWDLEDQLLDTLLLWRFGDYKNFTSLSLLCHIFNIPTPKDDISGADVRDVFYRDNDIDRIREYCEKDVKATAHLYMKIKRISQGLEAFS